MKKRLVSALLALSMLCSALPAPAFAQGADSAGLEQEQCSCSIRCTADGTNPDCPVCAADAAACGAGLDPATVETAAPEPTPEPTATPVPTETPAPAGEPAPQTLGLAPNLLAANDGASTLSAPTTLTVGGTNVLSGGCWTTDENGKLTVTESTTDYNVKYDSATGTLTLKDATINGTDTIYHVGAGIFASGDLTIVLEGSSTVKGVLDPNGETQSIRVEGNLTIQGGGSLTAQGAETSSGSSYGIFVIGSFTQQSGSVTASGGNVNGNYTSRGLYVSDGTVTAQDGTLTATGGDTSGSSYGISMASSSSVTVGSAAVTATGGTGNYSYGLYVNPSSPSVSPSVTLSGSGSLTARSGSGTDTAVGIYLNNIWGSTGSVTVGNGSTLLTNSVILFDNSFEAKPLTPTGDGSWLIYGQSDQPSAVGGTYTLTDDLTIENGNTFTIPAGSTLTVPQGKTLTVNGTLNIANQSSLTGSGSLAGSGAFNLTNPEPVISASETLTYDGTDHFNEFKLEAPSGSVEVMGQSFTISSSPSLEGWSLGTQEIKNAGTYTLTASNGTTTIEKEVTVKPATISITSATVQDKTYDGTTDATVDTVTFDGLVNGESLTSGTDYTATAAFTDKNAGDSKQATVTVTLTNGNYTFSSNGNTATATAKISPLAVALSWSETTSFTYDGQPHSVTATINNAVSGDDVSVAYDSNGTKTNKATAAGAYTATVSGLSGNDAANYTLTGVSNTTQTWSITTADSQLGLTVDKADNTYTYGEIITFTVKPEVRAANGISLLAENTVTFTVGDVELGSVTATEGQEVKFTYNTTDQKLAPGTHTVTATYTGGGNLNGTSETVAVTLAAKTLTAAINGNTTKTYDGTTEATGLSLALTGVGSGDTVTATAASYGYNSPNVTEANAVTASGIILGGQDAGFYTVNATATTTGIITPAVLTVTADSQTKTYGDADPELTYEVSGLVGEDKLTGALSRAEGENVGEHAITQGTLAAGSNYTLTFTGADLTITARIVTLSWSETTSFTYDGSEHSINAQVSNAVNGDTFTLTYENNAKTDVGSYTAKVTGLGNDNYTLTGATGTEQAWNIVGAFIAGAEVTLDKNSFTYNGAEQKPTVIVTLNGKALDAGTDYDVDFGGDFTNVGTVTVTVTGKGNYSGTATEKPTYTINPAPLTISGATLADKTYDGTTAATVTGVTFTEVQGSDSLTPGEDYTATAVFDDAGAGTGKTATVTVTLKNGNYKLASDTYQLTGQTIAKANAAVTAAPTAVADLTYNGQAQALVTAGTATGGTMVYSLEQNGKYAESIPTGTNAGDYTVWYKVACDANHNDTAPASEQVTIATKAATVTVQLDPANRITAGDDLPTVGLTYSGLVDGESLAPTGISVDGMPADSNTAKEYALTVSETTREEILALEAAKNYTITFTGMTLTILEKEVVVLPTEDENRYRLEQSELIEVPAELKEKYSEVEDIQNAMFLVAVEKLPDITAENTELHDVTLLFSEDGGKTWVKADEKNFPASGITVTLPYPDGTNAADYDFVVTHMATVAMNGLGVGEVETPDVTKTEKGLQFTVRSLSPVAVSWKLAPKTESSTGSGESTTPAATPAPTAAPAPDATVYYTCPACGHHDWTATDTGYRCDTCGYVESLKQLAGYGNVKGVYEPKTTGSAAAGTATADVPQTGDTSNPALWLGLLLLSGLALGGITLYRRKKTQ